MASNDSENLKRNTADRERDKDRDRDRERSSSIGEARNVVIEVPSLNNSSVFSKLANLMEKFRGKKHLIVLQGTPDPDAISSALALETIGELYDIETKILAFANVSHHENRALVKRLEINLQRYGDAVDLSVYSIYSIVDSQKGHTPIDSKLRDLGVQFLAFIDHHREELSPPNALFVDVRAHYGSVATIITEYLMECFPKGLEPTDSRHVRLATALMHGIRSDTQKFRFATQWEYRAAAFLASCVDNSAIEMIERRVLTSSMLSIFQKALVNHHVHDNFIYSDVGFVRSTDRDVIPQAAELLLCREGTDTVLVFGIVDEKVIDGSLRTRSETINPDEFLKGFLGISPESGKYYGGGNVRDRGGFQIPLGFLSLHENSSQVYSMARDIIQKSFLDYIGKAAKSM